MRALIVEDEPRLSKQLSAALADEGFAVDCAADGERADFLGQTESYDAIVLDLGLPVVDGLTVLRRWRDAGVMTPVMILTARGSWSEKVRGIDDGADDYMTKPFRMEELLARLRALIRRDRRITRPVLRCGDVALEPATGKVTRGGETVKLTALELRVLSYLMHHRGRAVSQGELNEHVYAIGADRDSNTIEVFVGRLRRKLGVGVIETVRGLGYRVPAEETEP